MERAVYRPLGLRPHRAFLETTLAEKFEVTMETLCQRLAAERGVMADI
jgi:transposase